MERRLVNEPSAPVESAIGQIFGDPAILAVLPGAASDEEISGYQKLIDGWQSESHAITIVRDGRFDLYAHPERVQTGETHVA